MSALPTVDADLLPEEILPPHPSVIVHESEINDDDDDEDDDIYRGEPSVEEEQHVQNDDASSSTSSSSSSSSGSFIGVRQLGAIAAVVEHAISRWARGKRANSSSSASSTSSSESSSSLPSITTITKSFLGRRKRRRGSIRTFAGLSELDLTARIDLIKAREQSRQATRQFSLYLPPSLAPSRMPRTTNGRRPPPEPVTKTYFLREILNQLDAALKKSSKALRNQDRRVGTSPERISALPPLIVPASMAGGFSKAPSRAASFTDVTDASLPRKNKGKEKEGQGQIPSTVRQHKERPVPRPWFLDVASPTSQDMHAIGKLLHLHPLTLEDILQQDPREKLELFPKLGYYFVSFRAVETRRLPRHKLAEEDEHLFGANVYLVVFREGVCMFHFTDASEHTNRVHQRLMQLDNVASMSSDWIAHGIMDSIIDSFFPFLEQLEKEVIDIEDLVFSGESLKPVKDDTDSITSQEKDTSVVNSSETRLAMDEKDRAHDALNEKLTTLHEKLIGKPRFLSVEMPRIPLLRRLRRYIRSKIRAIAESKESETDANTPLRRMARIRKLVTTFARLLAVKSEVVLQLRKRLIMGFGSGTKSEDIEIAMHMGDIHDHILALQHSLAHYERMLSQSHPIYLAQLRTSVGLAKSGTDRALIFLTVVSIGVLCCQTTIGLFSMNVQIPANALRAGAPFNVFGIIISWEVLVVGVYLYAVRKWWNNSKRRRDASIL